MMRRLAFGLAMALGLALAFGPAPVRADTLADIRAELNALGAVIARLRAELVRSDDSAAATFEGDLLTRVDQIEAALSRLTGHTEELDYRIGQIVTDATNRIGDIEFRLVELEGGDPTQLGTAPPLGGAASVPQPRDVPSGEGGLSPDPGTGTDFSLDLGAQDAPLMAADEQRAFEAARAALDEGRADEAATELTAYIEAYPGGPFTARAQLLLGQAHRDRGALSDAARVNLDLFVADTQGPLAAAALLALGETLADMGQTDEACVMFDELSLRFPGSDEALRGDEAFARLGCG